MRAPEKLATPSPRETLDAARRLLEEEAICLDERRWQDWIELFIPDCEYWVPTWKADGTLTSDPQSELSYIYYATRGGLEDRVIRITSPASPAAQPLPRTTHIVSNVRLLLSEAPDVSRVRATWTAHVFFPSTYVTTINFGHAEYDLVVHDETLRIARKKTVIQNDYMNSIVDVYCI